MLLKAEFLITFKGDKIIGGIIVTLILGANQHICWIEYQSLKADAREGGEYQSCAHILKQSGTHLHHF